MRLLLTTALALCPAVALAQGACPSGSDLAQGIEFKIDDGATETYTDTGNGIVQVDYVATDGYHSRLLLGKGIYLLEFAEVVNGTVDPGSRSTYSHSLSPADMPIPQPMGRWVSETATLDVGEPGREIHNHSFGPMTQLTIGACSYDMIPITVRYDDMDQTIDLLEYMPELGLAVLAGSSYLESEDVRSEEFYSYYEIRAVSGSGATGSSSGGKKGKKSE